MEAVTNGCAVLFNSTSLLLITLMSIERWLHMTRRSLLTERRAYIMIAVMLLLPIPLAIYRVLFITMWTHLLPFDIYFISVLLLCLLVTPMAYFKVIRILRHWPATNSSTRVVPQLWATIDRLCQVQEIGHLYPLYHDTTLCRLPANDCHFDGSCFFGKVSSDHGNFNCVNCTYCGIPIFRILDYSKLPFLQTKSHFPWICFSQTLLVIFHPIFRMLDFSKLPIFRTNSFFLSKIYFRFLELWKLRNQQKPVLATYTPECN